MKHSFTIIGNETSAYGNGRPKLRTTKGSQWDDKAKRYVAWKGHVVNCFLDSLRVASPKLASEYEMNAYKLKKPIPEFTGKCRMDIHIYFSSDSHGDPENIFGSIADALFIQDKRLIGSFDFDHDKQGRVEVTIKTP
jgi:hypothetical protein